MAKEKILIVAALTGFVRAFLPDDIKILQEKGYEIHCAANSEGDDYTEDENREFLKNLGVRFYNIPFSSTSPASKQNIESYKMVKKLLRENEYKMIHVHTPIPGVLCRLAALFYRKKHDCRVLYTTHGFYFHSKSGKKSWIMYYTVEKLMSALSDGIITINKEDFNNAKKMFCKNVFYINGVGVDTEKFKNVEADRNAIREELGIKTDDIALLSVGELSLRKNHRVVIQALADIKDEKYVYVICGKIVEDGGTYQGLKAMAEDLGVRVIFTGYRTDVPQLAKSLDIGVLPSLREGLGLAGIEMLAAGMPLVASNVHGIKDYAVDGETGYTADPLSAEDFARAIKKLSLYSVREDMRAKCRETAERYDMAISHEQRKKIYDLMLD